MIYMQDNIFWKQTERISVPKNRTTKMNEDGGRKQLKGAHMLLCIKSFEKSLWSFMLIDPDNFAVASFMLLASFTIGKTMNGRNTFSTPNDKTHSQRNRPKKSRRQSKGHTTQEVPCGGIEHPPTQQQND